ncbi:MAG TPA: hypothetical protein VK843_06300 [Planctomycetota bacterium]|nr:hypothetical protein [Planctomycetota bacterium]
MDKRSWLACGRAGRDFRAKAGAGAVLALLALYLAPGCCLVRPIDGKTLVEAGNNGWRTPEAAFETFRAGFAADLPELEFRSFSRAFREENRISYSTYRVARQKLIDDKPYLKLLANAEVVEGSVVSEGRHRLVVQAAGRRFGVELVREDGFQIYSGAVFLADGPLDFERAVQVGETVTVDPAGERVPLKTLQVNLQIPEEDLQGLELSSLTIVRVERVWKIDRFLDAPSP